MLDIDAAKKALLAKEPTVTIQDYIVYRNVFLFRVRFASIHEADYDPFFSVDQRTGAVSDFSVLVDGDLDEITALFMQNQK
jgi:hypothetical protein